MNRIDAKETIHEIAIIRDLLLCAMDYITELLREMNDGDMRMLTRSPKELEHRIQVVKRKNAGKLISILKFLYTSKKYAI